MKPSRELILSTAPYLTEPMDTPRVMLEVLAVLGVCLAAAVWNFGVGALLVVGAACAGAMLTEWAFTRGTEPSPLRDNSALITGVLLGLTLPPGFPLWMAFVGGASGIGLGKLVWGGLGQNLFNPALVGRAFLQASFPTAITTWAKPVGWGEWLNIPASQFAAPLMSPTVDDVTGATPLGAAKFDHIYTDWSLLFSGQTGGSLGETSFVLLILAGIWLGYRGIFDWRLSISTLLSVVVFSGALYLFNPVFLDPISMLMSGGLMFGAVFMVTDPATTPTTKKGAWIFGIGVGLLVVIIRCYGGLPEGVMYAILLMNALTPHINQYTQPRPFGAS